MTISDRARLIRSSAYELWTETQREGAILDSFTRRCIESALHDLDNIDRADRDARAEKRAQNVREREAA